MPCHLADSFRGVMGERPFTRVPSTRLKRRLHRVAAGDVRRAAHSMFGVMTPADWLIWGYPHTDHHLRQFGV